MSEEVVGYGRYVLRDAEGNVLKRSEQIPIVKRYRGYRIKLGKPVTVRASDSLEVEWPPLPIPSADEE